MKKAFVILIVVVFILSGLISNCFAQDMVRKLGRGIANTLTGPIEMLIGIEDTFYEKGPAAAVTYGVLSGLYKTALRTCVGVFEVVTFPIPIPADYAPIVEPEFLLSPDE